MSIDWLEKSFDSKKKVSESVYLMSAAPPSAPPAKASSSKQPAKASTSKGTKRSRPIKAEDDDDEDAAGMPDGAFEPPQKKFKDAQRATTANVHVPVDEGCALFVPQKVYIDSESVIWDANLNQTNAGANNNKFYRIQLIENSAGAFKT